MKNLVRSLVALTALASVAACKSEHQGTVQEKTTPSKEPAASGPSTNTGPGIGSAGNATDKPGTSITGPGSGDTAAKPDGGH